MLVRWAVPPTIAEGFADAEGLAVGVGRGEDERLCVGEGEGEALPEADGKGSRAMGFEKKQESNTLGSKGRKRIHGRLQVPHRAD